jgi:tetratricopeptide (TPR) repeat protein
MHRATALEQLMRFDLADVRDLAIECVQAPDPLVRASAVPLFTGAERRQLLKYVVPLLRDPVRHVRTQTALTLADLPSDALSRADQNALAAAVEEYKAGQLADRDQSAANLSLAVLAERMANRTRGGDSELLREAEAAYRTAIRVQPDVTGPRSNLSALLERQGRTKELRRLREEEFALMQRDVRLVPDNAPSQYRFGLLAYLLGKNDVAVEALSHAAQLEPHEVDYALALTLMLQKAQQWDEAAAEARRLVTLAPRNPSYQQLLRQLETAASSTSLPRADLQSE